MFKKVMIATDGSPLANRAVSFGLELAKQHDADATVMTVTDRWPLVEVAAQAEMGVKDPIGQFEAYAERGARSTLDAAAKIADEIGQACEQVHVKDRHPAEGIIDTAGKVGADLIVIASHGRRGIIKGCLDYSQSACRLLHD
ncbi:MAG: universal stress protein [Geminicoccaceae bacterium]